jgi:hypothetical protein
MPELYRHLLFTTAWAFEKVYEFNQKNVLPEIGMALFFIFKNSVWSSFSKHQALIYSN